MNKNVQMIIVNGVTDFMKLIELGIIDKETGCNAAIESKNADLIYKFAINVKGVNLNKLEDAIIQIKNAEYIYYFAKDIKEANKEKLEDAIIQTQNAEFIFKFARDVEGANVEKLEDVIMQTQNVEFIYKFARDVKEANIEKLENAIIQIKDAYFIYYFAKDIKGANIKKFEDVVIQIKDAYFIYLFAKDVKGANKEKLENAIMQTQNVKFIYQFARDIEGANKEKLVNAIVQIKIQTEYSNFKYSDFIRVIKETNMETYEDVMMLTQNEYFMKEFAKYAEYIKRSAKLQQEIIQSLCAEKEERDSEIERDTLNYLITLLKEKKYENIIENKEEYSKLFIEDVDSMERGRVLK